MVYTHGLKRLYLETVSKDSTMFLENLLFYIKIFKFLDIYIFIYPKKIPYSTAPYGIFIYKKEILLNNNHFLSSSEVSSLNSIVENTS